MDGEPITTDDHRRIGQRTYRAVVERFVSGAGPDDAVIDIAEHEAWFDSLADAGSWVDEQSASPLDGRVEEHVWQEAISVDREANRIVYDATRHPSGRFLDRVYYQSADEEDPHARWSFVETDDEPGRFDPDLSPADETLWEYVPGIVGSRFGRCANPRRSRHGASRGRGGAGGVASVRTAARPVRRRCADRAERARVAPRRPRSGGGRSRWGRRARKHRPGSWEADHVRNLAVILTGWS